MGKKNKKKTVINNSSYIIIALALVTTVGFVIFSPVFFPRPVSVGYFLKALDKIGAPEGFSVDPKKERVSSSPFDHKYARRAYNGDSTPETLREEMTMRFRQAGFHSVTWQDASDNNAAGLLATCKGVNVFARIYQEGNSNPIDIEVYEGGYNNAPDCPQL